MTRQREAIRSDRQKHRTKAVHAGLRPGFEVVRHHEENSHPFAKPLAVTTRGLLRALQLLAGRQQTVAVQPRPAVVLGVRQLDITRAHLFRHVENVADVVDVESMQHHIEHHRVVVLPDQSGHPGLQLEGAGAAQKVVHFARTVLERQLNMVQSRGLQRRNARLGKANARGNEIDVKAQPVRFRDQDFEILASQWLTTGQAQLNRAQRACFAHHPYPFVCREFLGNPRKLGRVVAKHAMQGAAVSQLQQEPQWRPGDPDLHSRLGHPRISSQVLSSAIDTNAVTSVDSPRTP